MQYIFLNTVNILTRHVSNIIITHFFSHILCIEYKHLIFGCCLICWCLWLVQPLGRVLLNLGMVGRFRGDDPRFWDFQSEWVPILCLSTFSDWCSLSAEKIGLSLSQLVPEILGPKIGKIFHQNVLFNSF